MSHNFTLLKQGAEAKIYESSFEGKPSIVKERFPKTYRLKVIDDKLRKQRLKHELKAIERCKIAGILTPQVYCTNNKECLFYMEKVNGPVLKDYIKNRLSIDGTYSSVVPVIQQIGQILATMHNANIIHGDLTTSNIMLSDVDDGIPKIWMIDFGLSSYSTSVEDKAVDLYVLERAFVSTHPNSDILFKELLNSYEKHDCEKEDNKKVLQRLDKVQQRGRKRILF